MPAIYINRSALHNFWRTCGHQWKRELKFWSVAILVAFAIFAGFFEIAFRAAATVPEQNQTQQAIWIGDKPTCPEGYSVWADESEAIAGRDSAVCVK